MSPEAARFCQYHAARWGIDPLAVALSVLTVLAPLVNGATIDLAEDKTSIIAWTIVVNASDKEKAHVKSMADRVKECITTTCWNILDTEDLDPMCAVACKVFQSSITQVHVRILII